MLNMYIEMTDITTQMRSGFEYKIKTTSLSRHKITWIIIVYEHSNTNNTNIF